LHSAAAALSLVEKIPDAAYKKCGGANGWGRLIYDIYNKGSCSYPEKWLVFENCHWGQHGGVGQEKDSYRYCWTGWWRTSL